MKQVKAFKPLVLLLSVSMIAAFVLTGCATVAQTTQEQISPTTAPTAQATAMQTTAAATQTVSQQQVSYVSIDVNPSIKLTVKDGVVTDVSALNDDGESIVLQHDVTGLAPADALSILIGALAEGGYITEEDSNASLVITTCGDNEEELRQNLEETAAQRLTELGLVCDVVVSTVENEIVDEAKQIGLTPGRYLLLKYLAEKEGITLLEAKEKYGSLKMGKLVKLVDDVDAVFGHKGDEKNMQELVDSGILTQEQLQVLTQAQNEFKVAMRQAEQLFKQERTKAQNQWKVSKNEIQNQFMSDKDVSAYKSSKTALKAQHEQQKQAAIQAFKQARVQARERFRAAVMSLGLTEEQIAALTQWDFHFDWDINDDWDDHDIEEEKDEEQDNDDEEDDDDAKAQSDSGGDHDTVNEGQDDDDDDDKDDESSGQGGKGNGKTAKKDKND